MAVEEPAEPLSAFPPSLEASRHCSLRTSSTALLRALTIWNRFRTSVAFLQWCLIAPLVGVAHVAAGPLDLGFLVRASVKNRSMVSRPLPAPIQTTHDRSKS